MVKKVNNNYDMIFKGKRQDKVKSSYDGIDNSVLSPTAQINNRCGFNVSQCNAGSMSINHRGALMKLSEEVYSLVVILETTGCRISEVLSIIPSNIANNGSFKIIGLKRSNNRLISILEVSSYMLHCKRNGIMPFNTFNRYFYYRLFKKMGIVLQSFGSSKCSVTHYFRHNFIRNMANIDKSLELVKDIVGHKSIKNTERYAKLK
jgi:integrase